MKFEPIDLHYCARFGYSRSRDVIRHAQQLAEEKYQKMVNRTVTDIERNEIFSIISDLMEFQKNINPAAFANLR